MKLQLFESLVELYGPEGFREVREAIMFHVHQLSSKPDLVVPSYKHKTKIAMSKCERNSAMKPFKHQRLDCVKCKALCGCFLCVTARICKVIEAFSLPLNDHIRPFKGL